MSSYKKAGVDVEAADAWVESIARVSGVGVSAELKQKIKSGVGAYAAVYASSASQWLALSCDGVGTKLMWTQEGLGTAKDLAQDLVAMNANDVLCVGGRPTLFLDYIALGRKELLKEGALLSDFVSGLAQVCAGSGQMLVGGETAQMPAMYSGDHFDLAGFSLGLLEPSEFLSVEKIQPGAQVWGWASNGPHSNGYSWLRQLFDSKKDAAFIREHLMKPTRLYVNDFLALRAGLKKMGLEHGLQSAYHITGSGLLNFVRAQPSGRTIGFDLDKWPSEKPLWVTEVQKRSGSDWSELYRSLNMGIGFAIILSPQVAESAAALLKSSAMTLIGRVIDRPVVCVEGLELS